MTFSFLDPFVAHNRKIKIIQSFVSNLTNFLMVNKSAVLSLLLFSLLISIVACGPKPQNDQPAGNSTALSATPLPVEIDAYPITTPTLPPPQEAYPAPTQINNNAILLALNKPINPGDTMVSGVGPPGLTVYLLNVTLMGTELGTSIIGEDGTFIIQTAELPSGIRIGLTADLTTIGLTENDIQLGEDAISIPQVGNFYDSYVLRGE